MLNQIILVGKIYDEPVIQLEDNGGNRITLYLEVNRFDHQEKCSQVIPVEVLEELATKCIDYLLKGMTVGVKGHAVSVNNALTIIADKITFINTKEDKDT